MAEQFIWLPPDSTEKLRQALNDAGPGSHVRIYGHGEHTTFHVVGEAVAFVEGQGGGINEAHTCPPICP